MTSNGQRQARWNLSKVSPGFAFLDPKEIVYLIAVCNMACKDAAEKQPLDMWQELDAIRANVIYLAEQSGLILKGGQAMVVMTYQMKCGHTQTIDMASLQLYMPCTTCKRQMKIIAIECREWKYKCQQPGCRVARFAGQSSELAQEKALGHYHNTNHIVQSIDYVRVDWKVKRVHAMFGKHQVKTYIIEPERSNKIQGEARRYDKIVQPSLSQLVDGINKRKPLSNISSEVDPSQEGIPF